MHDHDQEIIMALAEGTLDDAATATAEAAIAACADCTTDLELQRFALAALDEVPEAYLTATESARLHDALKSELIGAKAPPVRTTRSFAWGRWLPAAGVAAVLLVAIVSLPALFGGGFGGDDDASDETVAAPAESAETRAATETTAAASADMSDGAEMAGDADDTMALEAPTATTEFMGEATTTTAATETTTSDDQRYLEGLAFLGNVEDLEREALLAIVIADRDDLEEQSGVAKSLDAAFAACVLSNTSPEVAPGLGIPIESEPLLLGLVVTPLGQELILVAYVPESVEETVFVTQEGYFCEVVEVLP